ncbi:MAG: helix-turn-helix domain-containing protein [Planctomycetes bacterium]|nr:helix-turn-helix domain-containing protein [Planctomycetota bacterium]
MTRNTITTQKPESLAVTADDLAKLLNVSARHIWKLTATGKLPPPIRLGRSTRWILADVQAHLAGLRASAAGGA